MSVEVAARYSIPSSCFAVFCLQGKDLEPLSSPLRPRLATVLKGMYGGYSEMVIRFADCRNIFKYYDLSMPRSSDISSYRNPSPTR